MKLALALLAFIIGIVCMAFTGCAVSNHGVFPKLVWYWSRDAYEQRREDKESAESGKAYRESTTPAGIPNFAKVEDGVYRGGQPTEAGWHYLKILGVHNVIKLNEESESSDNSAWTNGIWVAYLPINLQQQIGFEEMPENFSLGWQSSTPLFIHCQHGQDRTGLFVALWRVKVDGWSKADAEKEMLAHGFHKELRGLWDYWEDWKPSLAKTNL